MAMLGKKIKKIRNWWQNKKNLPQFRAKLLNLKEAKAPYKVVLISHELSATGAPLMLLAAAKAILQDGGQVRVLAYLDGVLKNKFRQLGVEVFVHPDFRDNSKLLNEFGGDCDYAVANTVVTYPAISLLKGPQILWWIHEGKVIDDDYIARFRKKKFRPDLEETLRSAPKVAVVSDYAKQVVEKYSHHVHILNLAEEDWGQTRFCARQQGEPLRVAMLGAVCPIKGQDVALQAVASLAPAYAKQIVLVVAGKQDDAYVQNLKEKYKELSNVEWRAAVSVEQLKQFYEAQDVILVASRDESFSLVALEACMSGKPLIVSSNVGAKFLVNPGENGFVFESENAESLKSAIIQILDNRENLQKLGDNSRKKYLENATPEVFSRNFLQLLKNKSKF